MKKINTADEYFQNAESHWKPLLKMLREVIISTKLEESFKWRSPVYILNGKNVVGLGAYKAFVSIWFFQGVFLKDELRKLVNAQEGVTRGLRQWRFTTENEIDKKLVKSYIEEAIANHEKGLVIKPSKKKMIEIPALFKQTLNKNPEAKKAFSRLSQAKQRDYVEYISEAKREETIQNRIEIIIPLICKGRGINDRYRK